MKAYKGFDKDLKCRGFKYEVGKTYRLPEGQHPQVCSVGFHACESPLEVLDYYYLDDDCRLARFCEVEQSGELDHDIGSTKVASSEIAIIRELSLPELIAEGNKWLREHGENSELCSSGDSAQIGSSGYSARIGSSGDYAQICSSGDSAQIGSSGYSAQIGSSGYSARIGSSGDYAQIGSSGDYARIGSSGYSARIGSSGDYAQIGSSGYSARIGSSGDSAQINSTGEDSVICCAGPGCKAKAKVGSWITLAEWVYDDSKGRRVPRCVKTEYVDGERIKADTWYQLVDGQFTEAE